MKDGTSKAHRERAARQPIFQTEKQDTGRQGGSEKPQVGNSWGGPSTGGRRPVKGRALAPRLNVHPQFTPRSQDPSGTVGNAARLRRRSLPAWAWGQASVKGCRALRGGGGNSWSCVLTPTPPFLGSPPQDSSHGGSTSEGLGGQRGALQAERREGSRHGNWGALPQEGLTTAGQEGACGSGTPGEGALP